MKMSFFVLLDLQYTSIYILSLFSPHICYGSNLISGSIFLTWVDSQFPLSSRARKEIENQPRLNQN